MTGDGRVIGVGLDDREEGVAVHDGHDDIQQDQGDPLPVQLQKAERLPPVPASRTRYSEDRIPLSVARLISLSSTTKTVFCAAISLPLAPTRTRPWAYAAASPFTLFT